MKNPWRIGRPALGALLVALLGCTVAEPLTSPTAGVPAFGENAVTRTRQAVESLDNPCLFTSSEGDPYGGAENVRNWSEGLSHGHAKLVEGGAHGMAIYYAVRDDVLAFVKRALH